MNPFSRSARALWLGLLLAVLAAPATASASAPTIRSVVPSGTNVEVRVSVPAGIRRVTLEGRPRLASGAWVPRQTQWHDGSSAEIVFRLPASRDTEMLRVQAEAAADLAVPAAFFSGTNHFPALPVASTLSVSAPGGMNNDASGAFPGTSTLGASGPTVTRAVVESDIWQVHGTTVFFFNSSRGFQVIDASDPDHPSLRSTLPVSARGEQMYVLPDVAGDPSTWVALLGQDLCANGVAAVSVVRVADGTATLAGKFAIPGYVSESRLVGTALYLASVESFVVAGPPTTGTDGTVYTPSVWQQDTVVTSLDLADPAHGRVAATLRLPAVANAVMATDRFLFVATTGPGIERPIPGGGIWTSPGTNSVAVLDISAPDGSIVPRGSLPSRGRVADKFKLDLNGNVLTVVSQAGGWWQPPALPVIDGQWQQVPSEAWLETFDLADPADPAALGSLRLVSNESLFGTRFAGTRAYVVTFHRVDPLWIVDLADPAHPAVRGELQIPGYSSYLQPLGTDRLLAVGADGGTSTVALFDVHDDAHPALLSKVTLGTGWSWSEANSDEKAFRYFPDNHLVLVPWQGLDGNAWTSAMQLIDLDGDSLASRGVVRQAAQPRRAAVVGGRILTISSRDLLSVDFADRDQPSVVADLALGFRVDRVAVTGERLVEYSQEDLWGTADGNPPEIRIAPKVTPDVTLGKLALPRLALVGWDLDGNSLRIVQHQPDGTTWEPRAELATNLTLVRGDLLVSWVTNVTIVWIPQPPLLTNHTITNIQIYPLLPTDPPGTQPKIVTNVYVIQDKIPQPPLPGTNVDIVKILTPQPPSVVTNIVLVTNQYPVTVPGHLLVSTVDCTADTPALVGALEIPLPTNYWGARLEALKVAPGVLVWTETTDSGYYGIRYLGTPLSPPGVLTDGIVGAMPIWGGFWWGNSARNLVAVAEPADAAPRLLSARAFGAEGFYGQVGQAFVAAGRIHFSERFGIQTDDPKNPGQPGPWLAGNRLRVVDYADPTDPAERDPVELPGALAGLSHGGALLYTLGDARWETNGVVSTPLSALAYDGLAASLVATLDDAGLQPGPVTEDGTLLALRTVSASDSASLETWSLGTDAAWHLLGAIPAPVGASSVRRGGPTVVVLGNDQAQFVTVSDAGVPVETGRGDKPCWIWVDWPAAAITAEPAVWIPLADQGLVKLAKP